MARPFAILLDSAERQKMDMHRTDVKRAPYVYVPGYGVMPVVPSAGQPLGFQHAASAAGGSAAGGSALPLAAFQQSLLEASAAVVPHGVQALKAGGHQKPFHSSDACAPCISHGSSGIIGTALLANHPSRTLPQRSATRRSRGSLSGRERQRR